MVVAINIYGLPIDGDLMIIIIVCYKHIIPSHEDIIFKPIFLFQ